MADHHWLLKSLRKGIGASHEAQTSLYVSHVLGQCLRWPIGAIHAQAVMKGFIDYTLVYPHSTACLHVEVKRFGYPLQEAHIRKYLVQRGPGSDALRVGVLTNLLEWKVYVAGAGVRGASGTPMVLIKDVTIRRRSDIAQLQALIGYRANGSRLQPIRAAFACSPHVLRHILRNDPEVLKAIGRSLAHPRPRIEARVPQLQALRQWIGETLNGYASRRFSWSPATLTRTLRSKPVVQMVNRRLYNLCRARSDHHILRSTITQILKDCVETRIRKAA